MNSSRCRAYPKENYRYFNPRKFLCSESIRDIVKVHGTLVISKSKIEVSSMSINIRGGGVCSQSKRSLFQNPKSRIEVSSVSINTPGIFLHMPHRPSPSPQRNLVSVFVNAMKFTQVHCNYW